MENTNQDKNVLTIEWHVKDNWYGQNYRMVLSKSETEEFKNAKEAKQYRSLLVKYIKDRRNVKLPVSRAKFGKLSSFPTYIHSIGPSYSCTNMNITVAELNEWKEGYEETPEYREKQYKAHIRKQNKERREAQKAFEKRRKQLTVNIK